MYKNIYQRFIVPYLSTYVYTYILVGVYAYITHNSLGRVFFYILQNPHMTWQGIILKEITHACAKYRSTLLFISSPKGAFVFILYPYSSVCVLQNTQRATCHTTDNEGKSRVRNWKYTYLYFDWDV